MAPEDNPADDGQPTKEEWEAFEKARATAKPAKVGPGAMTPEEIANELVKWRHYGSESDAELIANAIREAKREGMERALTIVKNNTEVGCGLVAAEQQADAIRREIAKEKP